MADKQVYDRSLVELATGANYPLLLHDNGDGTYSPVSYSGGGTAPTGAATAANQTSELTLLGAVTETAPASDTASSGLNGRLQRIAQRITSVIALLAGGLPAALSSGGRGEGGSSRRAPNGH